MTGTGCRLTSECPADMWLRLPSVETQILRWLTYSSRAVLAWLPLTSANTSMVDCMRCPNCVMLKFLNYLTHCCCCFELLLQHYTGCNGTTVKTRCESWTSPSLHLEAIW